uniref:Ig-like domain-containing protein n=1 Tax=Gallus gallus TaxID=9031 RepID=A0A8V0X2K2_CHICK
AAPALWHQWPWPSSSRVSLGDTVTLFELYQNGHMRSKKDMDMLQDTVEFSLVSVEKEDAEKYRCQYRVLEPPGMSGKSDPVELVVTGEVPRPSLSLRPSQGVSLGDPVTLRCHLPHMAAWVWLYHEEGRSYNKGKKKEQDAAAFFFVSTLQEHAGRYWCQYRVSESAELSVESDPVELVLTGEDTGDSKWLWVLPTGPCPTAVPSPNADLRYPPCRISLHPEQHVGTGTNVTISCWNKDYGATFLLHKDGSSDPIHSRPSLLNTPSNYQHKLSPSKSSVVDPMVAPLFPSVSPGAPPVTVSVLTLCRNFML